ncbi:hypothetical protein D3C79_856860 [compost metagenome]
MLAGTFNRKIERQCAMLVKAFSVLRDLRLVERIMFALFQLAAFKEWQFLVENRAITRRFHIERRAISKPDHIVGNQRTHTGTRCRQPPMLHVAFRELTRGRVEDLRTSQ